jgi:hypothetical protein
MRSLPSPIWVALWVAIGVMPLPAAASPDGPVRVTTDSTAYCAELVGRLAEQPYGRAEPARSLAEEGQRLCGKGHVRTGIAKLRRALRAAQAGG